MKITFLGTGTSTGVPEIGCHCKVCRSSDMREKRLRTSALITLREKHILIDCGPDFRAQMLAWGENRIDAVLLTHEHYDHIAGLDDLRPLAFRREIPVYAEKRVTESLRLRMPYCFVDRSYPGVPNLRLEEITTDPFLIDDIPIVPIRVMHFRLPILGYRIGNLAYLTDLLTLPATELEKLKGIDTLVVNALRQSTHISHQSLQEALALIEKISPRCAYLTHISHQMGLMKEVENQLPDHVSFAYDGLQITLE